MRTLATTFIFLAGGFFCQVSASETIRCDAVFANSFSKSDQIVIHDNLRMKYSAEISSESSDSIIVSSEVYTIVGGELTALHETTLNRFSKVRNQLKISAKPREDRKIFDVFVHFDISFNQNGELSGMVKPWKANTESGWKVSEDIAEEFLPPDTARDQFIVAADERSNGTLTIIFDKNRPDYANYLAASVSAVAGQPNSRSRMIRFRLAFGKIEGLVPIVP